VRGTFGEFYCALSQLPSRYPFTPEDRERGAPEAEVEKAAYSVPYSVRSPPGGSLGGITASPARISMRR
jgi:hypothetical protein